jgi:HlyD family secretion protein
MDRSNAAGWEAPRKLRLLLLGLLAVGVVGGLVLAFRPQPVSVDVVSVTRGPLEVAVEEDGRTRLRARHVLVSPAVAELRRIELRPGDPVTVGQVVAILEGAAPILLDPRTEAQLRARLGAAEAGVDRARAMAEAAETAVRNAETEVRRVELLLELGGAAPADLERARAARQAREAELRSAQLTVTEGLGEVQALTLQLEPAIGVEGGAAAQRRVRSPVEGTVLRVHRESEGWVASGEPLLEVGDPQSLEVVVDLLSADAVRVREGAEAWIHGWGGEAELPARVLRVEPSGFTQQSALGISEQRVNVILEPVRAGDWVGLGDGFRVEARILIDRAEEVLRLPAGAVFRLGEGWAAFRASGKRIEAVTVELGRRSQAEVEIRSGLALGDPVVLYPGDRVADGVTFRERKSP